MAVSLNLYYETGDTVTFTDPNGQSIRGKFGGYGVDHNGHPKVLVRERADGLADTWVSIPVPVYWKATTG